MHFTPYIAALVVAFTSLSSCAPLTGGVTGTDGVTVFQEDTGRVRIRSGPLQMERVFQKYGASVPDHVRLAAAGARNSSVTTTPSTNDADYLSPVQIGTPPQTVMLDFDTGSSDLWVFTAQLPASQRAGHALYAPSKSSTSKQLTGSTFKLAYGDGSTVAGNVFTDVVKVGGVQYASQAVEAAQTVSAEFVQERNLDGLLGLGGPLNNQVKPAKQNTFFKNVRPSLASPVFAAYLKHQAPGAYDFGFLNPAHYSGAVYYTPATTSQGYYQITTTGYSAGSVQQNTALTSVVDTGTSLIFQPESVLEAYYNQIPSAYYEPQVGGIIFSCTETPPSFGINVGGSMRTTPGEYLKYATLGDTGYCFGGLQSSEGLPFGILGDVFLKSQYVVFDNGAVRVGFANQK